MIYWLLIELLSIAEGSDKNLNDPNGLLLNLVVISFIDQLIEMNHFIVTDDLSMMMM